MKFSIKQLDSVNNPNSIHGIYPYRGKISGIDAFQVLSQMPKGSTVLDPFCGSGTIIYEGAKIGLHTIGVDANPIAIFLARGKMAIPLSINDVIEEANYYIAQSLLMQNFDNPPKYTASLFHSETLQEMLKIASFFNEMSDYLKACFLGTICLAARGCNHYKWTSSSVGKNIEPKRYISFYEKLTKKIKKHYFPIANNSEVYLHDSRKLNHIIPSESVDYVFTSPPYFDCLDYTSYYAKFAYELLGYNRNEIRETLIQEFSSYKEDMKKVLESLYNVVKKDGHVIFVVGDKKIHGKLINGAEFFNIISPFICEDIIERSYSGTSSKVFDSINRTDRKEQIVIWRK